MQIANSEREGMIGMCAELCGYVSSSVSNVTHACNATKPVPSSVM